MKKTSLRILVLVLIVAEIYLSSAFLPDAWQTAIRGALSHMSPKTFDYSVVTHPALDYEIDQVLRKNVGLRVALYAVVLLLLAGNMFAITKVWRCLRLESRQSDRSATRS